MLNKQKLELGLLAFVGVGTSAALVASMSHMLEAFAYANDKTMAWVLAFVTVVLNGVFVALRVITTNKAVRRAVLSGMVMLFIVEFVGNFTAGGLLAAANLPAGLSDLYLGLNRTALIWGSTLLFAAFLPVLNFISVYALSEAGLKLVQEGNQPNDWAAMVLKMHEKQQPDPTGRG